MAERKFLVNTAAEGRTSLFERLTDDGTLVVLVRVEASVFGVAEGVVGLLNH